LSEISPYAAALCDHVKKGKTPLGICGSFCPDPGSFGREIRRTLRRRDKKKEGDYSPVLYFSCFSFRPKRRRKKFSSLSSPFFSKYEEGKGKGGKEKCARLLGTLGSSGKREVKKICTSKALPGRMRGGGERRYH